MQRARRERAHGSEEQGVLCLSMQFLDDEDNQSCSICWRLLGGERGRAGEGEREVFDLEQILTLNCSSRAVLTVDG